MGTRQHARHLTRIYNAIWPGQAQLCPGAVCEIRQREPIQDIAWGQLASVAGMAAVVALAAPQLAALPSPRMPAAAASGEVRDCTPPAFAVAIGHEALWKTHNGCD
jgi:hypothetical protein